MLQSRVKIQLLTTTRRYSTLHPRYAGPWGRFLNPELPGEQNLMTITQQLTQYFKESQAELKKVQWPTRTETVRLTVVVIGASIGLAAFLGVVDYLFTLGLQKLLNLV